MKDIEEEGRLIAAATIQLLVPGNDKRDRHTAVVSSPVELGISCVGPGYLVGIVTIPKAQAIPCPSLGPLASIGRPSATDYVFLNICCETLVAGTEFS